MTKQTESAGERRLPKRIMTFPLSGDYHDYTVEAWVNFPQSIRRDLMSGDQDVMITAACQLILSHDLVDFDGVPYPPANTPAFWEEIPTDLAAVIFQDIQGQVGKLSPPNGGR